MNPESNYKDINQKLWNDKLDHHVKSDFYAMEDFLAGKSSLNEIELSLLGEIKDKKIVHLQCHFGQDSISLARMGASVTGIDLSNKAIDLGNKLANDLKVDAQFFCADVYDAPEKLNQTFDMVFTSYGTIGWLPNINKWASVVASLLNPGGELVFAEFHPVVWMFDDDFRQITYNYFNADPIVEVTEGTYANRQADIKNKSVSWNHGMAEVMDALLNVGMEFTTVREFNYSPYNCFKNLVEFEPGKWHIAHIGNKMPMVYALKAIKKI